MEEVQTIMLVQTAQMVGDKDRVVLCVTRPEVAIRRETVLLHKWKANSYLMHSTCKEVKSLNWGEY